MEEFEIKEKIANGWIKCWTMIEVMATNKEVAEKALERHMENLKKEKGIGVYKETMEPAEKVEKKIQGIEEAYSQIVEIEFVIENLKKLVDFVIIYGPSAVEILEPKKIETNMGDAQEMLNRIATLIHNFAAAGAGGLLISPK